MIKVLNIVTTPICADGISNCILNYLENINNKNIKIDFACPEITDSYEKRIKNKNSQVHIIKSKRSKIYKYINELRKVIKENNYDIVHIHGSSTILSIELLAATFANCKHRIVHSHNTKTEHPIINKLLYPLFNLLCTERFACGEEAGKWLHKKQKFDIIQNGNDVDKFKFDETVRIHMREKYNLDNKIVIGHVGSFNEQKNQEFIIRLFDKLCKDNNKYFLILIGIGKNKERLEKLAFEKGIKEQILFTGSVDNVNEWLQAMDIMVLPSSGKGFMICIAQVKILKLHLISIFVP